MRKFPFILLAGLVIAILMPYAFAEIYTAGKITNVNFTQDGTTSIVEITTTKYGSYNTLRIPDPDRIVIDIEGVSAPGRQQVIEIGSRYIIKVRYAQFDSNTSRVVIEAKENPDFKVEKTSYGLRVVLTGQPTDEDIQEAADKADASAGKDQTGLSKKITVNKSISAEYKQNAPKETITLKSPSYRGYKIMRLTGPDRIVLDIPNITSAVGNHSLSVSGSRINIIRISKYGKATLRIVLDTIGQPNYEVFEKKGTLILTIEASGFKNVRYSNSGDRIYLNIAGVRLTQQKEVLVKYYASKYYSGGRIYILTFPSGLGDIGNGILKINDDYLNYVEIKNNKEKHMTSITFNSKGNFSFLPYYRSEVKGTNITILKPAVKGQKVVVIDAGHGGIMPGAIYGSLKEKDLNLDIAKRLDRLLKARKVKTYMLREDDSYIDNFERAYIANTLGAALYISVHNNAMDDPGFGGTMTLFYPQYGGSFNGRIFAQMVHERLLYRLKTTDRKILEKPNLVVLKETAMPAVLAEIAFMTNKKDRANLLNSQFREKAALAVSEGVRLALAKVK